VSTDLLSDLKKLTDQGSPAESRLAEALLADPDSSRLSAAKLAERAQVSQATVTRFSQSLGFDGLVELRLALASEISRREVELEHADIAEGEINTSDSMEDVIAKVAFHEARSIEQTARAMDPEAVERVARAIVDARGTLTFGIVASGLAASDLSYKLQRLGLPCLYSADTHMQLTYGALAEPGDVAIAFSFAGKSAEVHRALSLAKERGALSVAVTGDPDSPIGQLADITLHSSARESSARVAALASRMTQLAVVDFIFIKVAQLLEPQAQKAAEATKRAVATQKLNG
jgi:DNA-binding MurR/RpiR family transcriptional regulator